MLCCALNANEDLLRLSNIEELILENGMRVLFSQNYDYPTVYCHVYVNSGELDDPQNGGNLASFVSQKITAATKKYNKR